MIPDRGPGRPADIEAELGARLAMVREGWLAGHRAEEIARVTGIPVGLVGCAAVRVLGLPQRPPPDAARARARLQAWRWFRWWRRRWQHPRSRRRHGVG